MFSRRERLKREEFPHALSSGKRLFSRNFSIIVPLHTTGYAVVVPKKIARLSVTRHRIKRRVLEALHSMHRPKSLILFPKSSVLTVEYDEMKDELQELLSKIVH